MGARIWIMPASTRIVSIVSVGLLVIVGATVLAQRGSTPASPSANAQAEATARIVASAQALVATLDATARGRVLFPFDGAQKTRWSNLPGPMFQRQGLRMGDLTSAQRAAVMNSLAVALSRDGYQKVVEIMRGDEVLKKTQGGGRGRGLFGGGAAF